MVASTPTPEPRKSILRPRQPRTITPLSLDLTRRIPPEVIDIIIERLVRFDIPTLATCSLVCRAWLAASRHRLFTDISLGPHNAASFLRLLDSPHVTMTPGVRHISVQNESAAISHRRARSTARGERFQCDEALLRRLAKFPSLTSLCFSWLHGLDRPAVAALVHGFPDLTDLELRACTFPSFSQFTEVICALQHLRRVTLADVSWSELQIPEFKQRVPPGLQTLELYIAPIGHVCTWLASYSHDLHFLETVRLCSAFWEDMDAISIAWMLRRLGPKIKHLSLPWHLPEIDLSHLTELRTLHITHFWFQANSHAEECFTPAGVEKTLLQLSSFHLTSITYTIMPTLNEPIPASLQLDWDKIAKILARPCFGQLTSMSFGASGYDKVFRSLLREVWGVGRTPTQETARRSPDSARRRSHSKARVSKRLSRLRVDESFANTKELRV
ncbi:hypothetical protein Hypma_007203 [Hypsizygus marmoreus]|uniref:F-box domain-containing protein n=1 Tax=Hypsizygus marmoreus TaxID=39966 RepID=A0A369KCJ0_HYPMA|nr:hypothetical protein Hypma_007203 [Hypsizygus marmoreus]